MKKNHFIIVQIAQPIFFVTYELVKSNKEKLTHYTKDCFAFYLLLFLRPMV